MTRAAPQCAVTGAAGGIGRALALALTARGSHLVGVDRDAPAARELQTLLARQGRSSEWIIAELSSSAGVERVIDKLPPVDVLIHCAGINAVGRFERSDIRTQCAVLDVNLRAPLQLTRGLLARGRVRRGGSIVFVVSLSHFVGYPGAAVYAASKDGLAAYARSLTVALRPEGVHVMTVFPGPTRTAHAREHSPDNSREARRMPPDELAERIVSALERRRGRLVPGTGNKLFALLGRLAPALSERIMRRVILDKLDEDDA